jgi:hypothetical protein
MNSAQHFREYIANAHVPPQEPVQIDSGRLQAEINAAKITPVKTFNINDDPELVALVAHELRRGETLGEFVSRTGLSKAQASQMTKSQISSFCLQADKNNAEETNPTVTPRVIPSKFML